MKEIVEREREIDQEILEELERYQIDREAEGLDMLLEYGGEVVRFAADDFAAGDTVVQEQPLSANRDTSMISASGASSAQAHNQQNPAVVSSQPSNHGGGPRQRASNTIRR